MSLFKKKILFSALLALGFVGVWHPTLMPAVEEFNIADHSGTGELEFEALDQEIAPRGFFSTLFARLLPSGVYRWGKDNPTTAKVLAFVGVGIVGAYLSKYLEKCITDHYRNRCRQLVADMSGRQGDQAAPDQNGQDPSVLASVPRSPVEWTRPVTDIEVQSLLDEIEAEARQIEEDLQRSDEFTEEWRRRRHEWNMQQLWWTETQRALKEQIRRQVVRHERNMSERTERFSREIEYRNHRQQHAGARPAAAHLTGIRDELQQAAAHAAQRTERRVKYLLEHVLVAYSCSNTELCDSLQAQLLDAVGPDQRTSLEARLQAQYKRIGTDAELRCTFKKRGIQIFATNLLQLQPVTDRSAHAARVAAYERRLLANEDEETIKHLKAMLADATSLIEIKVCSPDDSGEQTVSLLRRQAEFIPALHDLFSLSEVIEEDYEGAEIDLCQYDVTADDLKWVITAVNAEQCFNERDMAAGFDQVGRGTRRFEALDTCCVITPDRLIQCMLLADFFRCQHVVDYCVRDLVARDNGAVKMYLEADDQGDSSIVPLEGALARFPSHLILHLKQQYFLMYGEWPSSVPAPLNEEQNAFYRDVNLGGVPLTEEPA